MPPDLRGRHFRQLQGVVMRHLRRLDLSSQVTAGNRKIFGFRLSIILCSRYSVLFGIS
jgi:hypothetical protein